MGLARARLPQHCLGEPARPVTGTSAPKGTVRHRPRTRTRWIVHGVLFVALVEGVFGLLPRLDGLFPRAARLPGRELLAPAASRGRGLPSPPPEPEQDGQGNVPRSAGRLITSRPRTERSVSVRPSELISGRVGYDRRTLGRPTRRARQHLGGASQWRIRWFTSRSGPQTRMRRGRSSVSCSAGRSPTGESPGTRTWTRGWRARCRAASAHSRAGIRWSLSSSESRTSRLPWRLPRPKGGRASSLDGECRG